MNSVDSPGIVSAYSAKYSGEENNDVSYTKCTSEASLYKNNIQ